MMFKQFPDLHKFPTKLENFIQFLPGIGDIFYHISLDNINDSQESKLIRRWTKRKIDIHPK